MDRQKPSKKWAFLQLAAAALPCVFIAPAAYSFDCNKAKQHVEILICADENLLLYDRALSDLYLKSNESPEPQEPAQILKKTEERRQSQRTWLRQRNKCLDIDCITKRYDERLAHFFNDARYSTDDARALLFPSRYITCEQMRQIPRTALHVGLNMDYGCEGGLESEPFMERLLALAAKIRGSSRCEGSVHRQLEGSYRLSLTAAGQFPEILPTQSGISAPHLWQYFDAWSAQSPYNYHLYNEFKNAYKKASRDLPAYYQSHHEMDTTASKSISQKILLMIADHAAGSPPDSSYWKAGTPPPPSLAQRISTGTEDISLLLQRTNKRNEQTETHEALNIALANKSSRALIEALLANTDTIDQGDESALFFALNDKSNAGFLLTKGASVNYQNGFGKTPLFYAIERSDHELIELLLNAGADANHAYKSSADLRGYCEYQIEHTKRTPIMHAAQHSDMKSIEILLKSGAKLHEKDELGFNALDYAIKHNRPDNAAMLRTLGLTQYDVKH